MSKQSKKQKTIAYGNKKYIGVLKNGVVTVRVDQTAKGQLLIAGIYNIAEAKWHDACRRAPLPWNVQKLFEDAFNP